MKNVKSRMLSWLIPICAVSAALALGAVMLMTLGANPVTGFATMFNAAFGNLEGLSNTAVKAIPLLLVGVGICIAFRANVINIGGEGQMVMGAMFATVAALLLPDLNSFISIPIILSMGILGGAVWGAIPGALKAYFNVSEILSTIMLNIVAVQFMNFMLRGPLIDPGEIERGTRIPQTARLPETTDLPVLFESVRLHLGVVIAVIAAIAV